MLKRNDLKILLIHISLMMGTVAFLFAFFFYFCLPIITRHGQSITVPNLKGITLDEVDDFLKQRSLRFAVTKDDAYSDMYPPLTILKQHPRPGSKVKKDRKIYITLNAVHPPKIKMPLLVDSSMKNAQILLKSNELLIGEVKYVPDIAKNAVLEQWYNGEKIETGIWIPKGSKIDLVVGAGLGKKTVKVPIVSGLNFEVAEFLILETGLKVGSIIYEVVDNVAAGTVFQQVPQAKEERQMGETVDLWIADFKEEEEGILTK